MKELSIEEKAKRYDEALKWMEGIYPTLTHEQQMEAEAFFPKLKESEDEKIRKRIISALVEWEDKCSFPGDSGDMIAWLEKQGEQKPQGKTALEAIKEEKVDNANKVEPKFKVGDWISGYYTNYKVLSVNNDWYLVEDVDGNKINILFENEKFHHLFTIADAKDGDVLSWDDSKCITIFKNIYDKDSFNSYGFVGSCTGTFESRIAYHDIKGAHPATREQRDLLFTKMEEAGYEWDARKKELNKVEQKEAIHKELTEFEKAVKQVMEEAIECGDTHNLKADADMLLSLVHNSAWSEEDDIMKQNCHQMLALLRPNSSELIKDIIDNCHHWLKALKDRVQLQSTWKPSDEQMETLENVRKILHSNKEIYSKANSLMYNFEELIRTITKLKE